MPNIMDMIAGLFGGHNEPQRTAAELEIERRIAEKKYQKMMNEAQEKMQNLCAKAAKAEKEGNHALALQYTKQAMMYKNMMTTVERGKTGDDTTQSIREMMKSFKELIPTVTGAQIDTGMIADIVKQNAEMQAANLQKQETMDVLFEAMGVSDDTDFVGSGDPAAEAFLAGIVSDQQKMEEDAGILNETIEQLNSRLNNGK